MPDQLTTSARTDHRDDRIEYWYDPASEMTGPSEDLNLAEFPARILVQLRLEGVERGGFYGYLVEFILLRSRRD